MHQCAEIYRFSLISGSFSRHEQTLRILAELIQLFPLGDFGTEQWQMVSTLDALKCQQIALFWADLVVLMPLLVRMLGVDVL